MISLDEARAHVLGSCVPGHPKAVPLADALGLVTSVDLAAAEDVPPFDNTAMDGFAVRAEDTRGAPVRLKIAGTIAAGAPPDIPVEPGHAVRIMTGAPMPPGADAIVMVERTTVLDGQVLDGQVLNGQVDGEEVEVQVEVEPGLHDLHAGDMVFPAFTPLSPAHLGVLASVGLQKVPVFPRPRVGVISTGDELVEGPGPLGPGQIRDSNRRMLLGLVAETGVEAVDLGLVRDDEAAITTALTEAAEACDAVITSGGVSMGDGDYVKAVLDRIGAMRWMQVTIRPAKPLAFGTVGTTPVFGLPGNPVSSLVSFELFARPSLRRMMGHPSPDRPRYRAVAGKDLTRRPDGKIHFARVVASYDTADGRFRVRSAGGQGSHQLSAMATANALAVLPDGDGVVAGGDLDVILLQDPVP